MHAPGISVRWEALSQEVATSRGLARLQEADWSAVARPDLPGYERQARLMKIRGCPKGVGSSPRREKPEVGSMGASLESATKEQTEEVGWECRLEGGWGRMQSGWRRKA